LGDRMILCCYWLKVGQWAWVAKYLKSTLLNYDVLDTAASQAGIISF